MATPHEAPLYNVLGQTEHGKYVFAGQGGEQIVYFDPYFGQLADETGDPRDRVVVKLNLSEVRQRYAGSPDLDNSRNQATAYARRRNDRYEALLSAFGNDVPWQSSTVRDLMLSPAEMTSLWGQNPVPEYTRGHIIAVVTLQDGVPEYKTGDYFNLRIPYAERRTPNADLYVPVNHRWISSPHDDPTPDEHDEYMQVQKSPELKELMDEAESNNAMRNKLIDFIGKTIRYVRQTGEILDISGPDNALFMANGRCILPDVLYPDDRPIAWQLSRVIRKAEHYRGLTFDDINVALNGLGFVRSLNYLAARFGVPERLELFTADVGRHAWQRLHDILTTTQPYKNLLLDATSPAERQAA